MSNVVNEARRWLGTPFVHTGRELGVGVDCCGLVICVFNSVYGMHYDNRNYSHVMPNGVMRSELARWCDQVLGEWESGDVLLFDLMGQEQHVGFYTGDGQMLHAYQSAGVVAEHAINDSWRRRVVAVFRWRGFEQGV